jgi:MarR family 2-MHQ and catechol resistance regulon transcriptional repressor
MGYRILPLPDELVGLTFLNEQHKLRVNLLLTSGWLKNNLNDILATFDLTVTQYNALRILNEQQGIPISTLHLREKMLEKMSDTPKIVDRLVKKGLVIKKISTVDRRLVDITIAESGRGLLQKIISIQSDFDQLTDVVTEEEAALVNAILTRLRTRS